MMHNLIILSFALVCTAAPVQEVPSDYEPTSAAQIPEQELSEDHRGGRTASLLPYSAAATATALLLFSIFAVISAVRLRRQADEVGNGAADPPAKAAETMTAAAETKAAEGMVATKITTGEPADDERRQLNDLFLNRMETILELHMPDPDFSVEDMAREMAMSRAVFFKRAKEITGNTPYKIMTSIRLRKAAELLSRRTNAINEVSRMVGIKDTSHFIRLFKDTFGLTPKEYRRRQQGSGPEKPLPNQEK